MLFVDGKKMLFMTLAPKMTIKTKVSGENGADQFKIISASVTALRFEQSFLDDFSSFISLILRTKHSNFKGEFLVIRSIDQA